MRSPVAASLGLAVAAAVPPLAYGHAERPAHFPDPAEGSVPSYRTKGPSKVVCKPDSRQRIERDAKGSIRRRNLRVLKRCRFRHIQDAVEAATSGDRILIMPGLYREEPSRAVPDPDPRCQDMYVSAETDPTTGTPLESGPSTPLSERVPSYEYQRNCPRSQNLIAVTGDGPDPDRKCDDKCNIQIEGLGRGPRAVLIQGDRRKLNVVRADRADGIYLRNFTVEFSDFNNVYALETNGFRFDNIESRYSREYGFLSFVSDNGLYENLEAFGSGDSGIYPGSGPEGHCGRYGIEIRNVDSHDNTIGYSGTAGNGIYAHDNRFHHNATGMTTDSFASGHPGMPQDCARWERNEIYSNNADLFNDQRDQYCRQPYQQRDPTVVCPTFQVPVGTGLLIAGGNGNITRDNYIYDNWRQGVSLFWVPAAARGDSDPTKTYDTSHFNRFLSNVMGLRPAARLARVGPITARDRRARKRRRASRRRAKRRVPALTGRASPRRGRAGQAAVRDPNGVDFWWDEEGAGNCWAANVGPGGSQPTSDPSSLPVCPGSSVFSPGNPLKQASQAPCATWDPHDNPDPPGCNWFTPPPEPR